MRDETSSIFGIYSQQKSDRPDMQGKMRIVHLSLLYSFLATLSVIPALAVAEISHPDSLIVKLNTGTFRGARADNGTERWLGIPYAVPPLGRLRFKAPVPLSPAPSPETDAITNSSQFGNACPQPPFFTAIDAPISEDCLVLNVWRPTGTPTTAKLPILLWIYGGTFNYGTASDPNYEPTRIVTRSVAIGKPIIFVSINYRINTFGFLASSHVPPEDLNAGLLDQRLALQFVQSNIGAFGGDPSKVTIWGQSAGGGSVEAHVLFPAKEKLFRAAITDSSTGPFKSSPLAAQYDEPGTAFTRLLDVFGCSIDFDPVDCLRDVPFLDLMNVTNVMVNETLNMQFWEPVVGPPESMINMRASEKIESGDFLHVPYLAGTNLNEGTQFAEVLMNLSHPGVDEDIIFDGYVGDLLVDNRTVTQDVLDEFHILYPANSSANGGQFNTGDSLFDRAAAWYTDEMFLAPRRLFFEKAASTQPLYGYLFTELVPPNPPLLGVQHGSELALLFGTVPAAEEDFANQMLDFYISFVNELTPGGEWPRYTPENRSILQLMRNNVTVLKDEDFSFKQTEFLNSMKVLEQMEK